MTLIIGGAHQGKLDYARRTYSLTESDILDCRTLAASQLAQPPLSAYRCIYHYESYIEHCLLSDITPQTHFLPDQIILSDDISCGVVPTDPHLRAWREACGRALTVLAANSSCVIRIFCGIPLRLK